MMPATIPHRDALTLLIAGGSVCLTMFLGHFKNWRHKICLEYDGKQDAAVIALRDKFQEEAEQHYRSIQDHIQRTGGTVQDFYAEGRQRTLVKTLALRLERSNQIIRLYTFVRGVSQAVEVAFCVESSILILGVVLVWLPITHYELIALLIIAGCILILMVGLMFVLLYVESKFLNATNKALRPEFD